MALFSTRSGYRMLALSAALALPGLTVAQQLPAEALRYFATKGQAQGLNAADVANPLVTSSYYDAGMGLTHTYLLQRVNGVPVFGATGDLHTDRNGQVVSSYQAFVPGAAVMAASPAPTLSATDGIVAAAAALGMPAPTGLLLSDEAPNNTGVMRFNNGRISVDDILVQLGYTRTASGLALAWNVTMGQATGAHYWSTFVDAHTGRLLDKTDLLVSEQAAFDKANLQRPARKPALAAEAASAVVSSPAGITAASSVTAIALPLESPGQGARSVVAMPALGNAYSPFGWAVGQSSATFLDNYSRLSSGKYLTRGNNVAAYDDYGNTANTTPNLYSSTSSPDGGATMSYDFPFNQPAGPRTNLNPAITNLFYANNMMHDVMMAHGFDEAAANYQYKNNTTAPGANDFVQAEAQDGSGRNNANFTPTINGVPGRMQMYLWDNVNQTLTITAPSSIAGRYTYQPTTSFGGDLAALGSVCGNIVPVKDGVSPNGGASSCSPNYTNSGAINGNIALIQRKGCSTTALNAFVAKVKNAQLNGATLAIVYGNIPTSDTLVTMSGSDPDITIPAIFISGRDGAKIRAALTGNTVAVGCAYNQTLADLDGSLDNGVMCHEYGHGISNRLTGGGATASCVTQGYTSGTDKFYTQCPGEGWSDFFALWMTTKAGDFGNTKRYMGTYVNGDPSATGPGLRAYPYSINMGVNPSHYGLMTQPAAGATVTYYQETHGLGEIWTSVLWDLNWQFIAKYGFNTDFYSSTVGGNNKCLKLVLDGCKIQPCNPSFLQARNAILKADSLANLPASPNRALIWTVFARRGMGYSANGGIRNNNLPMLNVTEAFDMPPGLTAVTLGSRNATSATSALEAYPNPAANSLTVRTQLNSAAPVQVTLLDLLGKAVLTPVAVPAAQMQQSGTSFDISQVANGIYVVRVATTEGTFTTKVTVQH